MVQGEGNWTLHNGWDSKLLAPARASAGSLAFSDYYLKECMIASGERVIILVSVTLFLPEDSMLKWSLEVTVSQAA